jgi:hypothetical protein
MIDMITYWQVGVFSIVYWGSLMGAVGFVIAGPDLDENDRTLGGVCYNVLVRLLLAAVALVVWYYVFTFILFLFFETLGAL